MSAEDELGLDIERIFVEERYAAEFARFWDDTESDDANFRIISWWLEHDGRCSPDEV